MGAHVPFDPQELRFLNNFYTRFPYGTAPHPNMYPNGLHRFTSERIPLSMTKRQDLEEIRSTFPTEVAFQDFCSKYSDRYLDQTATEFYTEIDDVMDELGISMSTVTYHLNVELYKWHNQSQSEKNVDTAADSINSPLRPIYQALRERGYNWKDLAA